MKKTWKCDVCGYIHEGESPPEICPICGVDASHFELVEEESEGAVAASAHERFFSEMRDGFVPHAVAAHFPNALIPTAGFFALLLLVTSGGGFADSVFYLLCVSLVMVPLTMLTGLYDWKTDYGGSMTAIFKKKIILSGLLLAGSGSAVFWLWSDPDLLLKGSWQRVGYFFLLAALVICVALLGHYGGKLVFGDKKKQKKQAV